MRDFFKAPEKGYDPRRLGTRMTNYLVAPNSPWERGFKYLEAMLRAGLCRDLCVKRVNSRWLPWITLT